MQSLEDASFKLEVLGVKHMPIQYLVCSKCGANTRESDGRYITLREPPGVYYLRGDDNIERRTESGIGAEEKIQIIALFAEFDAAKVAEAIGWKVESAGWMPGPDGKTPIGSTAFFVPKEEEQMTTTVKVHVNGRYRATVIQKNAEGAVVDSRVVEGNYDGSSNPSGEASFWLTHPAHGTFEVSEEYLGEAVVEPPPPATEEAPVPEPAPADEPDAPPPPAAE